MSISIVSLAETAKSGSISIKPFFDPTKTNLGLEKYGMALFDGIFHEEQLACIERNGIQRYLTGLNEYAPEIKAIADETVKEAKIKEIRKVVSELERDLAANYIKVDDPDFWSKVVLLKPDNHEFWSKITIRCGNEPVYLDPVKDPHDLIKLYAIEAGGFSIIGKSFEEARSRSVAPKFYLDKFVETVSTKTEVSKLRNKAISELTKLFDKNQNKLLYVAKICDGNSVQYKKSTPNDVVYDNMDKFIRGEGVEPNIKRAAQTFIDAAALDMETLKIRAIVKDSTYYKFIIPKSDGFIYHTESNSMMGRNAADCIEYLKNPLQDAILLDLTKKLEKHWNL